MTQLTLFDDPEETDRKASAEHALFDRERRVRNAEIALKKKYGSNAVLKGMNLSEGATAIAKNGQVGGHRSGDA